MLYPSCPLEWSSDSFKILDLWAASSKAWSISFSTWSNAVWSCLESRLSALKSASRPRRTYLSRQAAWVSFSSTFLFKTSRTFDTCSIRSAISITSRLMSLFVIRSSYSTADWVYLKSWWSNSKHLSWSIREQWASPIWRIKIRSVSVEPSMFEGSFTY